MFHENLWKKRKKWEESGRAKCKLSFLGCIGLVSPVSTANMASPRLQCSRERRLPLTARLIPGDPQATGATVAANADLATNFPTAIMPQITPSYLFI